MKHVVELKYTNPSHEHVSLRRRVETVNRVVEAQSADEALNRAANQQRSLGFRIQSANIVEQVLAEEVEQVDEAKVSGHKMYQHHDGSWYVEDEDENVVLRNATKSEAENVVSTANKKLQKGVTEEVEQVDEANMRFDPEAAARPKSSDVKNFQMRDKNPRAAAASKKYIRRMTKLGGLGPNQTKKDTEAHMKAHFDEETGADKRDAGYKMSPAVRAAQKKSDELSKVVKPVQAGTLAAQRRRAEMKKEEVETVDEGIMSGLKKAQVKWRTAHRAVYGTDPSAKSMVVGAIARLAGAKAHTARAVGSAVGGKPVSKQQQAAAIKRAGKPAMARMRNEEKETANNSDVNSNVKGKLAADKMTKKAAEVRKSKIEGSVNQINMEPMIDLHRPASLDPNKRIQK